MARCTAKCRTCSRGDRPTPAVAARSSRYTAPPQAWPPPEATAALWAARARTTAAATAAATTAASSRAAACLTRRRHLPCCRPPRGEASCPQGVRSPEVSHLDDSTLARWCWASSSRNVLFLSSLLLLLLMPNTLTLVGVLVVHDDIVLVEVTCFKVKIAPRARCLS